LNIARPLFDRLSRQFGASLQRSLPREGFRTFASKRQNGFVGTGKCFVVMSSQTKNFCRGPKKQG
jgi:hypothetical protein